MCFDGETVMLVILIVENENFEFRSFIVREPSTPAKRGWYILIPLIAAILTISSRAGLGLFWWRNSDVGDPQSGERKFRILVIYCL
jgi:hypothetical protein